MACSRRHAAQRIGGMLRSLLPHAFPAVRRTGLLAARFSDGSHSILTASSQATPLRLPLAVGHAVHTPGAACYAQRPLSTTGGLLDVERPVHVPVPQQPEASSSEPDNDATRPAERPRRAERSGFSEVRRPDYVIVHDNTWADKMGAGKLQRMLQTYPTVMLHPRGGPQAQYMCMKLMVKAQELLRKEDAAKRLVFHVIRLRTAGFDVNTSTELQPLPRMAYIAMLRDISTLPEAAARPPLAGATLRPSRDSSNVADRARSLHKALQACLQNPELQQAQVQLMGAVGVPTTSYALNTVRHVLRTNARQEVLVIPSFEPLQQPGKGGKKDGERDGMKPSMVLQLHVMAEPMPADDELLQRAADRPPPFGQAAAGHHGAQQVDARDMGDASRHDEEVGDAEGTEQRGVAGGLAGAGAQGAELSGTSSSSDSGSESESDDGNYAEAGTGTSTGSSTNLENKAGVHVGAAGGERMQLGGQGVSAAVAAEDSGAVSAESVGSSSSGAGDATADAQQGAADSRVGQERPTL